MDMLLLVGILLLNVAISVWNCYAVGSTWKDVKAMGSKFEKFVMYSAIIQSGVGFSMPILIVLGFGSVSFLTAGSEPTLSPAEGAQMMEWIFSLWYLAVIFPILGSGFAITAHSIRAAYQRRDFASMATAGYNTFAQIHNTVSAVNNLGGVFNNVGELFGSMGKSKGDGKGKAGILVLLIVVLALVAGFMIAFGLVKYFANRSESRLELYADEAGLRA